MAMAESSNKTTSNLATIERDVEARSTSLKKELGLRDLVLTQVVFVVGTVWVGFAAKLGQSQMAFWLIAIATFYLPLAAVVIYLNRLAPLEGGLYQWAKVAFDDFVAFMVAWNFWIFGILVMSGIGLIIKKNIAYAIGPRANWMHENKWMTTLVCVLLITFVVRCWVWIASKSPASKRLYGRYLLTKEICYFSTNHSYKIKKLGF